MLVNVKIDEYELLEMLMNRVEFWTQDNDILKLYEMYYESILDCFDGMELNIDEIVDNDYINWLSIYDEKEFEDNQSWITEDRIMATYNGYYLVNAC